MPLIGAGALAALAGTGTAAAHPRALRRFFRDHERPGKIKKSIHAFLRAVRLVQRLYRGYAACTKARLKALRLLWRRSEETFVPPQPRRPLGPLNTHGTKNAVEARRRQYELKRDKKETEKHRAEERGLSKLDKKWAEVDAQMTELTAKRHASTRPTAKRGHDKWTMSSVVRDAVLEAVLDDARLRHQATWSAARRQTRRAAPRHFNLKEARSILRVADIKKRAAPLPPTVAALREWPILRFFAQERQHLGAIVDQAYAAAYAADKAAHLKRTARDLQPPPDEVAQATIRALRLSYAPTPRARPRNGAITPMGRMPASFRFLVAS